ncbi:type II toxin-antitoxin system antitoxin HipB [Escherichia coli]|uniref:type II toxin-antitoxin system antitoxin HipB n=1 Tax=Escherichia coli TaxID=562 RepID=UPI00136DBDF4|nr:type II toxin-antitoxin system antitoxin HipB [Escherichia coli]MXE86565.1 type II toxin-antitoxin system antitoxin HipB [Escherichia coli]
MRAPAIYSPKQLANHLKLIRQKHALTQSELAAKVGIKQATISNFENNPDKSTLKTFFKLVQALELSLVLYERNDIVDDVGNSKQKRSDW